MSVQTCPSAGTRSRSATDETRQTRRRSRSSRGTDRAAQRAADRRRQLRQTHTRMSRAGRPVRSAMLRVPFVIALIAVLAAGVGGVLYLNTRTDESGMRTEKATATAAQLRLQIEALHRSIAELNATPRIAREAQELGLVQAGDAAILVVNPGHKPKLIGTPAPAGGADGGAGPDAGGAGE